jgi:acetyl esterase/lipase
MKFTQIKLDERYACIGGGECLLSAYLPDNSPEVDADKKKKAVLVFPGGGYWMVSDRENEPIALSFAAAGYNAYTLKYSTRGTSGAVYPVQALQALAAIDYIKQNADADHTDKDGVFAIGFSAGGHLCGMAGLLNDDKELLSVLKPKQNLALKGLCFCYPVVSNGVSAHIESFKNLTGGDGALTERLSVEKLVRASAPPAFIWHTADDACVSVMNSLLLAAEYAKHKIPFELHVYKTGSHGLSLANDVTSNKAALAGINPVISEWFGKMLKFFDTL